MYRVSSVGLLPSVYSMAESIFCPIPSPVWHSVSDDEYFYITCQLLQHWDQMGSDGIQYQNWVKYATISPSIESDHPLSAPGRVGSFFMLYPCSGHTIIGLNILSKVTTPRILSPSHHIHHTTDVRRP